VTAYNKFVRSPDYNKLYHNLPDKSIKKAAILAPRNERIGALLGYNIDNESENEIKQRLGDTIYKEKEEEFKEIAERAAQELPSKTHCFYYDDSTNLKGFISAVSISEGGRGGGSGYEMRADKVNEVHYQFIQQKTGDNYLDGLVRTRIFGLDNEHERTETPTIKNNRDTNGDNNDSFYPTNWPYDKKKPIVRGETSNTNSRFWYYKNFKSDATRRNKPKEPSKLPPFPPRLTNNQVGNYTYFYALKDAEKTVKLTKKSYRKWKKVNHDNSPLQLGRNDNKRIDAGTAMADALRGFPIHQEMIEKSNENSLTPKVSNSKLPATAFVKYVLDYNNDTVAQAQWKMDNLMETDPTKESLRTDQEWCHLYGHGDGGSEDLSNFVAGSKHCNTEQLAIEVGQRRVTQADFFKDEAKKITAKITAYLLPNQGTWLTGGTYTQDELKKELGGSWNGYGDNNYTNWRDQFFSSQNNAYQLKPPENCKTAFESLSDKISKPDINKDLKKHLLKFKHSIETHFFMYLPIARWMRYKIYYDHKKVFDHIYDAQSESTNVHECKILDDTVERVLYKAIAATADEKRKALINLHYETTIVGRSLKFIPDEPLMEKFKETVNRQKKIDRLWSSKKQNPNSDPLEIDGLIEGIDNELNSVELKQKNLSKPQEFYKNILTEQKTVLEGLEGTDTPDNVNSNGKHTLSNSSELPPNKKQKQEQNN
jgi:hypothetical protein